MNQDERPTLPPGPADSSAAQFEELIAELGPNGEWLARLRNIAAVAAPQLRNQPNAR